MGDGMYWGVVGFLSPTVMGLRSHGVCFQEEAIGDVDLFTFAGGREHGEFQVNPKWLQHLQVGLKCIHCLSKAIIQRKVYILSFFRHDNGYNDVAVACQVVLYVVAFESSLAWSSESQEI